MSTERTFYSDAQGVRITGTRAVFPFATYTMTNINAVRSVSTPPRRGPAWFLAVTGLVLAVIGIVLHNMGLAVTAFVMVALAVAVARAARGEYHLMIISGTGESIALTSHDSEYVDKIAAAMNEVLTHRGSPPVSRE